MTHLPNDCWFHVRRGCTCRVSSMRTVAFSRSEIDRSAFSDARHLANPLFHFVHGQYRQHVVHFNNARFHRASLTVFILTMSCYISDHFASWPFSRFENVVCKYDLRVRPDQPLILAGVVKPAEQILDDVEPRQTLVVGAHQSPRRHRVMRARQHLVAGQAVGFPVLDRLVVDRTDFPLLERVRFPVLRRRFCSALLMSR